MKLANSRLRPPMPGWRSAVAAVLVFLSTGLAALAVTPVQYDFLKLRATDGATYDLFGVSVALDGDTAVVGASSGDDDNGVNSGSAYVYVRDGTGNWSQQAKLLAADGAPGDAFGIRVALDGNTAVVGALSGSRSGSAYVFVRDGAGNWSQQAKLFVADGAADDFFGGSVALDGDTAVVGAFRDDDNGFESGSAYVFVRDGAGLWSQQAKLLAADGAWGDFFGISIALSGDTVIVGADEDEDERYGPGSAYLFVRDAAGLWSQQAKLLATDGAVSDQFGWSVALDGDTAVVGTPGIDYGSDSGAAYVFVREGAGHWSQQAKLLSADGAAYDRFGSSVALDGDTTVVGAKEDDDNGVGSGSAYVFVRDGTGNWTEQSRLLASDGAAGAGLGHYVGVSGGWAIAGAPWHDASFTDQGAAYLFAISAQGPRRVGIDNKPSNPNNPVNPFNNGRFWVAILAEEGFDPLQVDVSSVRFGPSNATTNSTRVRDVNHDGLPELMLRFVIPELGVSCGMERLSLSGRTFAGDEIFGDDFIRTVGCARRREK